MPSSYTQRRTLNPEAIGIWTAALAVNVVLWVAVIGWARMAGVLS